ncbi:arginine--tRNA ligase [candidate division GN15 bacterium]|uniref:Arginine--tRNA ligase n=1 Tax=candidate division GN15 bacterium TaxID=2072418 RepID=A0A855XB06_9BACT|nr:MAG: arginine--tRNA ligase [candidate division GN15 bacterium]
MSLEQDKDRFADAVAEAFRQSYPEQFETVGETGAFSAGEVRAKLEKPKDARMGRFALPVFPYLKLLRAKPDDVASRVAAAANSLLEEDGDSGLSISADGGYLNAKIDQVAQMRATLAEILRKQAAFGNSNDGAGKTILVEYSAPNIAKPFGVGHLRSTIIGNSLRLIFKKLGYHSVGLNYPGDWGTQFGKMIVAFRKWGSEESLQGNAVRNLLDLYVRFHKEAERDAALEDEARLAFKNLEDGEPEATKLWERFKTISYAEFDRIYTLLGVEFDVVYGESFLNDKMNAVIDRLKRDGLVTVSDGALIVDLKDPQLPPSLLRRSDGATLYQTRDLAGMVYRWERWHFHECLYVVGSSQADHFKQALKVIEMMETAEQLPEAQRMAQRLRHIGFGWVKFGGKAMKTREGTLIFLEEVIDEAVKLVREKIEEKNPDLKAIDETALMIGVGAVVFSQLSVRRHKDVNFDWDEVLSFEGETGPYLQYTHARLCSLLRNYGREVGAGVDFSLLDHEEEHRVVELLADFPDAIRDAAANYDSYYLATYLLRLAGAFNKVYQRKDSQGRIDKIISENRALTEARMALVISVVTVLREGLRLLGLKAPEEM